LKIDLILHDLDRELRKDFKTACAHYGLSMKEVLIRHMQTIVNDYRAESVLGKKSKDYSKKREK